MKTMNRRLNLIALDPLELRDLRRKAKLGESAKRLAAELARLRREVRRAIK